MKYFKLTVFLLFSVFIPIEKLSAENINDVIVGAFYYTKGLISDEKIQVLDLNKQNGKVKVLFTKSKNVDLVSASSLITRSESIGRDIDRIDAVVSILGYLYENYDSTPNSTNTNETSKDTNTVSHGAEADYRLPRQASGRIFYGDDFDIWSDRACPDSIYIYHGPKFNSYALGFRRAEYRKSDQSLMLIKTDGSKFDIGSRIVSFELRQRFLRAKTLYIIRTEKGETKEGFELPLSTVY